MARRIEGPYDFSRYNFSRYADGATWELDEGDDFTVKPQSLTSAAREFARREGLNVEYKIIEATPQQPTRVAVRFTKPVRDAAQERAS